MRWTLRSWDLVSPGSTLKTFPIRSRGTGWLLTNHAIASDQSLDETFHFLGMGMAKPLLRIRISATISRLALVVRSWARPSEPWITDGSLRYREQVVEGLANAPAALLAVLAGSSLAKTVVVSESLPAGGRRTADGQHSHYFWRLEMTITGNMLIGRADVRGKDAELRALEPATNRLIEPSFGGGVAEVEQACRLAAEAFDEYSHTGPEERACFIEGIARNLEAQAGVIVERCMLETGLSR